MATSYTKSKRSRALAKRYISDYDAYVDNIDLNEYYNLELSGYIEELLIEKCGYKKEEQQFEVHRPRKVGTRPPKRKFGERPPRIGERKHTKQNENTSLSNKIKEIDIQLPINSQAMPVWKKKLWRKIMLAVHPDRIDVVSTSEKDKSFRVKIREGIQVNDSDAMLIAAAELLSITTGLPAFEQERHIRTAISEVRKKNLAIFESAPWLWGESFTDNNLRLEIIKAVLINNSFNPPADEVILDFIARKNN